MRLGVGVLVLALIGGLSFALADEQGLGRCNLDERAAPVKSSFVSATVRGPATAEEIRNQTAVAIRGVRAPMSPAYANLPRVFAFFVLGGVRHGTIAAVVDGHIPAAGDEVRLATRRRDPDLPCHFIPWTVVPGDSV